MKNKKYKPNSFKLDERTLEALRKERANSGNKSWNLFILDMIKVYQKSRNFVVYEREPKKDKK